MTTTVARSLAVLLAGLLLAGAGAPASPPARRVVAPYSDTVFLALGRGDFAEADRSSADWLAGAEPGGSQRAAALQTRLDVLVEIGAFKGDAADALAAAIGAVDAGDPRAASLKANLAIARALAAGKAEAPRALAAAQELGRAGDPAARAEARYGEVRALAALGRSDEVRAAAGDAIAAWHEMPGKRARFVELALLRIVGRNEGRASRFEASLAAYVQSEKLATAEFGEDSVQLMRGQSASASSLEELGRYGEARAKRESALAIARRRFGERHLETAKAEAYLGASLETLGDYTASREHFERASAIAAELTDVSPLERAQIANNHANLLQEMDQIEPALKRYREALAAVGEAPELMHTRAVILANVGNTEFKMARYDDATQSFRQALALREQADGKDSPGLAYALEGLGSTALAQGQYAEAEPHFRRAVALRSRALPKEHPALANATFGLALSRYGQGDLVEALALAETMALNQQALRTLLAPDLSERQSVAYRNLLAPATALAVTLAAARGDRDSIARAWRLVMIDRGLVARTERRRLAAARASADPALAQSFQRWRLATSRLSDAWLGTSADAEELARLHDEVEDAERALGGNGARGGAPADLGALPLEELARALPKQGLLVAYAEGVAPTARRVLAAGRAQEPEDWYAFELGADGNAGLRRLGRINALSAEVRGWYALLRDPGSARAVLQRQGAALATALLGASASRAAPRTLFVVPEGELYRVSFAALPIGERYAIETGLEVHTLAHESDLTATPRAGAAGRVLLAGAPEFPRGAGAALVLRQACANAPNQGFAPIPHAAEELAALRELLRAGRDADAVRVLTGADATKERVRDALPDAAIVHLATHGFSLDASCSDAAAAQRGMTLSATPANDDAELPPLAGLAFSGASLAQAGAPVGILSAAELAGLDLSRADWLALSACDSGTGPIGRGEGVFGMRRAARLAGARTVVMSLWPVDDEATAGLMAALYRARFAEHASVPGALAQAMRHELAERRAHGLSDHPYYWAAFVGEGAWR